MGRGQWCTVGLRQRREHYINVVFFFEKKKLVFMLIMQNSECIALVPPAERGLVSPANLTTAGGGPSQRYLQVRGRLRESARRDKQD